MRGGFDIGVVEEEFSGQEDRRWLHGSRSGWDQNLSITLDVYAFTSAHLEAKGAIPGGTVLAKLPSGLYGPYTPRTGRADEIQKLTPASAGATTVGMAGNDSVAATFAADEAGATALEGIIVGFHNVDEDDVAVTVGTGGDAGKLVVTFGGKLAGENVPTLTVSGTGTAISTATAGAEGTDNDLDVAAGFLFTTTKVGNGTGSDLASAANVGTALYWGPGIVHVQYLPTFSGTNVGELDAAARTDLSNFIKFDDA